MAWDVEYLPLPLLRKARDSFKNETKIVGFGIGRV